MLRVMRNNSYNAAGDSVGAVQIRCQRSMSMNILHGSPYVQNGYAAADKLGRASVSPAHERPQPLRLKVPAEFR